MTTARPDSRLGTDLGPYRIERILGRGGMGVVYLAEQRELGRKVALKLLPDELAQDADFRARFERESRLAAAIDHPNVIPLYEAGEVDGVLFLAMRYVDGTDLASRLREGPLLSPTAIELLGQVAGALDAAHTKGLVHRDVKPGNVLLDRTGSDERPHAYLTDFGLTKQAGSDTGLTRAGAFLGTPAYMAPEQVDGTEVDGRADQYALGAMAFECLTGRVPFVRDKEVAVALAHLKDPVPSAVALQPALPASVDTVLAQAMAKDREARYPSCAAFIEDLRAALGGGAVVARPVRAPRRRTPLVFAAALGLGLLVVAGAVLASGLGAPGAGGASPSGSLGAVTDVPQASPTPAPTPISTTFPTPQEAAFIAKLPTSLSGCERVKEKDAATLAGLNRRVTIPGGETSELVFDETPGLIRLGCSVDTAEGADRAFVFWDPRLGSSANNAFSATGPEWAPDTVMGWLAGVYELPDGDCATTIPAYGRWTSAGEERGRVGCRVSDATGKAWIYWTDEQTRVYGYASAPAADGAALYGWWKLIAPFIIPPSDS